jgi:hypothetical protein
MRISTKYEYLFDKSNVYNLIYLTLVSELTDCPTGAIIMVYTELN